MNYDANAQLVEGGVYDVDDTPKYKLGKTITTDDGKTFAYVKATAALTAGTTYKVGSLAIGTVVQDGADKIKISATTPTIITNVTGADVEGALVKVTDTNSVVKGVFAIEGATDDGSAYIYAPLKGVETTDTVAGVATTTANFCGGAVSSGKAQGTPLVAIASGKYGWVLLQSPDAVSA